MATAVFVPSQNFGDGTLPLPPSRRYIRGRPGSRASRQNRGGSPFTFPQYLGSGEPKPANRPRRGRGVDGEPESAKPVGLSLRRMRALPALASAFSRQRTRSSPHLRATAATSFCAARGMFWRALSCACLQ